MSAETLGMLASALQEGGAAASDVPTLVVWLVPLLPFLGFLFQVFIGHRLPKVIINIVSVGLVGVSAALSWYLFSVLMGIAEPTGRVIETVPAPWIEIPGLGDGKWLSVLAEHKLVVDTLTSVMILVVTNVGFLIHLYSTGYMAPPGHEPEKRYARYFAFLNLFTGFMLILVMASNLLLMFVGWEGVGLCSYLLIGFWYEEKANAIAGIKAFVVNRVGDLFFTIGLLTLFVTLGNETKVWTVDFAVIEQTMAAHPDVITGGVATFIALMMFLGATGKSAQIPLYTWLPDAMAGPTPVSALIHAATMVTAGVYMVARMDFLYVQSATAMAVVAGVGAVTALFAGTIGMAQNDIKKVLAYSTVSQLGFMFLAVGVGAFSVGIFHLFTHAFFKACLFLGSGSVILAMGHEQDIRKMGGLWSKMKVTCATFVVSSIAIAGIPPLAGFFSKDAILENAALTHAFDGTWLEGWYPWALFVIGAVAAFCTAYYMTRLVVKTFFGRPHWQQAHAFSGGGAGNEPSGGDLPDDESALDTSGVGPAGHLPEDDSMLDLHGAGGQGHGGGHGQGGHHAGEPKESPWTMTLPLVLLALGAIVVGFLNVPQILGGHNAFSTWLHLEPEAEHGSTRLIWGMTILSVLLAAFGIGAGIWVFLKRHGVPAKDWADRNPETYQMLLNKYYVDEGYDKAILQNVFRANETAGRVDNEIIDGAVNGAAKVTALGSKGTGYLDNEVVDAGVNAAATATQLTGRKVRRLQTGNIKEYLTFALVGGLFIIAAFCLWLTRLQWWPL